MDVIWSYGLGVESTATFGRWCLEANTRPCDLKQLTVISAMVGDEYKDTGTLVETHILPMMRQYGVSFVQVDELRAAGDKNIIKRPKTP